MRVLFYAPLKPPDHPVPSGDRRVARLVCDALARAGHDVELAARLRSLDRGGDPARQKRIAGLGRKLATRLLARIERRPRAERPRAFVTYHLYYKAPDWIGPAVAEALGIPYVVIEASIANKRAEGKWQLGHAAACRALALARAAVSINPADDEGVLPHLAAADRLHRVAPFLDAAPFASAARARATHRGAIAQRFGLDPAQPWLLTVAMMRADDKLKSYRVLGAALAPLGARRWQLLVVGDGDARDAVEAALAPVAAHVRYAGRRDESELAAIYAAADLYAWPAISEAYGMATLEAQAAGVPAVAGDEGGVGTIVAHGETGLLTPPGDADAFRSALATLLDDPARRKAMGAAALAKVARTHDIAAAATALDRVLASVT
jgi:glycosyltransferase involved in cell wall biosynthesis